MVGFGAWWTYFDFAGHRHPRQKPSASLQWMLSHLPLFLGLALVVPLSIPWALALARRLANPVGPPIE